MSRLGENQRRGDNQRVEHGGAARPSASTSGGSTPAGYHPARRTSSLTASLSRLGSGLTLNLTLTLTLTLILTLTLTLTLTLPRTRTLTLTLTPTRCSAQIRSPR